MKKLLLGATLLILLLGFAVPSLAENPGTINSKTWLDYPTNWEGNYVINKGPVYVAGPFNSSNGTITNNTTGDAGGWGNNGYAFNTAKDKRIRCVFQNVDFVVGPDSRSKIIHNEPSNTVVFNATTVDGSRNSNRNGATIIKNDSNAIISLENNAKIKGFNNAAIENNGQFYVWNGNAASIENCLLTLRGNGRPWTARNNASLTLQNSTLTLEGSQNIEVENKATLIIDGATLKSGSGVKTITGKDNSTIIIRGNTTLENINIVTTGKVQIEDSANLTLNNSTIKTDGANAAIETGESTITPINIAWQSRILYMANGAALNMNKTTLVLSAQTGPVCTAIRSEGGKVQITDSTVSGASLDAANYHVAELINCGDVTIKSSKFENNENKSTGSTGGAIYANSSTITISDTQFVNNKANRGGAIFLDNNSTLNVTSSRLTGNNANNWGGAIAAPGGAVVTLTDTDFSENKAVHGAAVIVRTGGELTVSGGSFEENKASWHGGAIQADDIKLTIKDGTVFKANTAEQNGGAVFMQQSASTKGKPQLTIEKGVTFTSNTAGSFGGAVHIENGTSLTIADDATFKDNSAKHGGALRIEVTETTIGAAIFTSNRANSGASGGALDVRTSNVTVNGTTFEENGGCNHGGAIAFYTYYNGNSPSNTLNVSDAAFRQNTANIGGAILQSGGNLTIDGTTFDGNLADPDGNGSGGAVAIETNAADANGVMRSGDSFASKETLVDIKNSVFKNNNAPVCGGALSLGYDYYYYPTDSSAPSAPPIGPYHAQKDVIYATISGTQFLDNNVTAATLEEAGGAIFLNNDATLRMDCVAIYDNKAQDYGAAIGNCPNGMAILNLRNGVAIFDNTAGGVNQDIWLGSAADGGGANEHIISERMYNGGWHNWQINGVEYTANPDAADKAFVRNDNPSVLMTGNTAKGDASSQLGTAGGAIGNNGVVIIGEPATAIHLTKLWKEDVLFQGASYRDQFGPKDIKEFVSSLQIYDNQGRPMLDWNVAQFIPGTAADAYDYRISNVGILYDQNGAKAVDPYIYIDIKEIDKNTYDVWIEALPVLPNGAAYDVKEAWDKYVSTIVDSTIVVDSRKILAHSATDNSQKYAYGESYLQTVTIENKPDTILQEYLDLSGEKIWMDGGNTHVSKDEVTLILNRISAKEGSQAEKVVDVTPTWDGDKYTFNHLEKYDDEWYEYTYFVTEEAMEGFATAYGNVGDHADKNDAAYDKGTITNIKTTKITVNKLWDDNDDAEGKRPEKIIVHLHANGTAVESREVTAADEWKTSFTDLPVYEKGEKVVYTITEDHVPGYTHEIDESNYIITNTYNPTKTNVEVEKTWEMGDHTEIEHPQSVIVHLLADGERTGRQVELSDTNKWHHIFKELDLMKDGKEIVYTVEEEVPADYADYYKAQVIREGENEFLIVNEYAPKEPEPQPPTDDTPDNPQPPTDEPEPEKFNYPITFTKEWRGDVGDHIDYTMYYPDGSIRVNRLPLKYKKSETEWVYKGYVSSPGEYYIIEDAMPGYKVRYENVAPYENVKDRCYNGGTIINYKVPKTGDTASPALWIGLAVLGLGGLSALATLRGKKKIRQN